MESVNISCSLSNTGYGIASKYLLKELYKNKVKVALFPKGRPQADTQVEASLYQEMVDNAQLFDYHAPFLNIWHQNHLAEHVGFGRYFAWPIFELDTFNEVELHHLNFPSAIIVCSDWAKTVLLENGINKPIFVVPLGVDTTIFKSRDDKPCDKYRFINVGKWEKRKGHDILGKCFSKAFTKKDDVELIMMPHNPFLTHKELQYWLDMYSNLPLAEKIVIGGPAQTHQEVADVMSKCDCGVFPSRAEGWNMELLECMACNLPVITTNYSAHTEYCHPGNAFLIEQNELEKAHDGKWFFGQGNWMEFDYEEEEQLIEYMRFCYRNNVRDNRLGLATAKRLSWENSCKELFSTLFNKEIESIKK